MKIKKLVLLLFTILLITLVGCTSIDKKDVSDIKAYLKDTGYIKSTWAEECDLKGEGYDVGGEANPAKRDTIWSIYKTDDNVTKSVMIKDNGNNTYSIVIAKCNLHTDGIGNRYIDYIQDANILTKLTLEKTDKGYREK